MAAGHSQFWRDGQLGSRGQRLLKVLHLAFAGVWLGSLAAVALLLWQGERAPVRPDLLIGAFAVHERLVFMAFIGTLATGLLFSLFTKWGFFTHDWISVKWALALLLFALTLAWQSPALSGVAGLADAGVSPLNGHSLPEYRQRALRLAAAQLGIVGSIYFISTLKPWGRRNRKAVPRRWLLWGIGLTASLFSAFGTYNHLRLRQYRNMSIEDATAQGLPDGDYRGGIQCGVAYEVVVRVRGQRIGGIDATQNLDNHYASIAEAVLVRIQRAQHTRVDAITGATTTSKCLMAATANALLGKPQVLRSRRGPPSEPAPEKAP